MTSFFDSHAHLTASPLLEQVDAVLARAKAAHVTNVINICTGAACVHEGIKLSQKYPWVYHAAAVHPHDAEKEGEQLFPFIAEQARQGRFVAIGETGLDYYYTHSSAEQQKHYLRMHFKLALECQLPVIIHCREAFADFFDILDADYQKGGKLGPGVLHCFTGTLKEAEQVLERDWYVSISGIVTFKKSIELREVAKLVPLDRLLIETDAPYLAPQSHRGKVNEPAFVVNTAEVVASVKGISVAELAHATSENARRLFCLRTT
ncbi:MAG: TatD family hydrolase [Parachlamydiaceae bacterium]|nr:TatD family hydrolase [Parachlamydiaceae bacterium]